MTTNRNFSRFAGVLAAGVIAAVAFAPAAVQAQGEDCLCIVAPGTVGMVTSANGWVKLNGDLGLVDATLEAPLSVGSVLRTGAAGNATATVGSGCNVNVAALSRMSISALEDGRMCVRLTDETPVPLVTDISPVAVVGAGAVIGGGALLFGLGQDEPVSQ